MGSADFCPVCGEVIGGWDYDETTDCQCITGVDSNGRIVDQARHESYQAKSARKGSVMSDAKTSLDRLIEAYPEASGVGHVNLRNMTIAERAKFYELYQQAVGEIVWMLPSSGGENTLPNDVSDAEYWFVEAMTNTTTVMLDLLAGLRDTVEVE